MLTGYGVPLGVMKMPWDYIDVVIVQHFACTKCPLIFHFKILIYVS